jgi:hypothetical protein
MIAMTRLPNDEEAAKNSAEWMSGDAAKWRSYVEGTRGKYINHYASFARQHTKNYSRLEEELANMVKCGTADRDSEGVRHSAGDG